MAGGRHFMYDKNVNIFTLAKVTGTFSASIDNKGNFSLHYGSFSLWYTIFVASVELLAGILAGYIFYAGVIREEFTFDEGTFYVIVHVSLFLEFLPFVMLMEAKKVIAFLNCCKRYQVNFEKVTRCRLEPPSFKYNFLAWVLGAIFLCVTSLFFGDESLFSQFNNPKEIIPFLYLTQSLAFLNFWTVCSISLLWITFNKGLRHAVVLLVVDLKKKYNQSLREHFKLWLHLRELCLQLGDCICWTLLFLCGTFFIISLPSLYSGVNGMLRGKIHLLVLPVATMALVSVIVDIGHQTVQKIGDYFLSELSLILINSKEIDVINDQLTALIQNTAICSPKMTFAGFFSVSRDVNMALYSSMITYLVIIVQFRMGNTENSTKDEEHVPLYMHNVTFSF